MEKYNMKNPSVKRIMQEVKEMQSNPSDDFMGLPLEENIFEWQFAIRGPAETEFEGGIYHGRIQLPPEYPLKPPSFMLLTPNGRFETQTKICLSISNYHPEHWQPSWSVRTALVALIAFMPTNPNGALGSLEYSKEERKALAIKSRVAAPRFGTPERQRIIDEIHDYMLSKASQVPEKSNPVNSEESSITEADSQSTTLPDAPAIADASSEEDQPNEAEERALVVSNETPVNDNPSIVRSHAAEQPATSSHPFVHRAEINHPRVADDRLFNLAAVGLTIAIVVLLLKKIMKANGYGAVFMDESYFYEIGKKHKWQQSMLILFFLPDTQAIKKKMIKLAAVGNTAEGDRWDGKGQKDVYQLFISYDNARPVGLQVQYIDEETSSLVLSDVYGKMSGSNFRAIRFDYPSEYITWLKVEGSSRQGPGPIAMKTNLGNCYGPFPNQFHREISDEILETGYYLGDENQFGGFHGTADGVHGLRSLGVYVQPVSSLDTTVAETSNHVPVPGSEALKID